VIADALKAENKAAGKREAQEAQYKRDMENAAKVEYVATMYLRAGSDPAYIAQRYGMDVERCRRYQAAYMKQQEQKHEREQSARGDREAPEIGSSDHSPGRTP
jgi:hypothetical protein